MVETVEGNVITFTQYSKKMNEVFDLPDYIKAIIYAEGDKYEREAVTVQAKWREKQEADIAAKKAAIQAKKDLEKAERKRKAAEKKAARAAAEKAKKAASKKPKKSDLSTYSKTSSKKAPKPEKKKKEETLTDMWSNWRKGK